MNKQILDKLNNLKNENDCLLFLIEKHPDVIISECRGQPCYCAKSINNIVTHVYFYSAYEAYYASPYVLIHNFPVYSQPCYFRIGEHYEGDGIFPSDNWKQDMIKCNIAENIIKQCEEYLNQNPPIPIEENQEA